MKKLSKIFIMLCLMMGVVCLASCGGDDDDDYNTLIVGVWVCTSVNDGSAGSTVKNSLQEGDIFTVNSDMTYSMKGTRNSYGHYSINKDEFIFDGYARYKIITLSSTTLTMSINLYGRVCSWTFRRQ